MIASATGDRHRGGLPSRYAPTRLRGGPAIRLGAEARIRGAILSIAINPSRLMTENVENLILEHLRHIRGGVDQIAEDLGTVTLRLLSLESQVAGLHGDNAISHQRMDSIERRLECVERRLDLHEPA
jgi:hypothetical protein